MLIQHLQKEFAKRARKNHRYSLRAFARALDCRPATLSALLNQRRALTPQTARKLIDSLDLDFEERKRLLWETIAGGDALEPRKFSIGRSAVCGDQQLGV